MGAPIRPSFELRVPLGRAGIEQRVALRLRTRGCPVSGLVAPGRIELHVHGDEQRIWSPQLIVDVVDVGWTRDSAPDALAAREPTEAVLRCRFGPHPSVWTLYAAGYAFVMLLGFAGLCLGLAEWVLSRAPLGLLAVPAALVLAALLYGAALLGQGLGREQMERLRRFLEETLDERAGVESSR
jgi:hypothetical protein